MNIIFEVHINNTINDYSNKAEAIRDVEKNGAGYIVKFIEERPGRCKSISMDVFSEGVWTYPNIHG